MYTYCSVYIKYCVCFVFQLVAILGYAQVQQHLGPLHISSDYLKTSTASERLSNLSTIDNIQDYNSKSFTLEIQSEQNKRNLNFVELGYLKSNSRLITASGTVKKINPERYYTSASIGEYLYNLKVTNDDIVISQYNSKGKSIISTLNGNLTAKTSHNQPQENLGPCSTTDPLSVSKKRASLLKNNSTIPSVEVYIEIDYHTYLDFNMNIEDIENWVSSTFAQVSSIYAIHDINIQLSEIFIWDIEDPYYNMWSLRGTKDTFAVQKQGVFNGHVACLLTTKNMGGAKANIDGLCQAYENTNHSGPYAVLSSVSKEQPDGSSYFWNTFLLGHEIGHVLGSPHTHACLWGPENNQAIDDCYGTEGTCNSGTTPINGGTLMSYCYNQSSGINFANGLGQEPATLIKQNILDSECITICLIGESCDDHNDCTMYDSYNADCQCLGTLVDMNQNSICDLDESCDQNIYVSNIDTSFYMAKEKIQSNTVVNVTHNVVFSATSDIVLEPGFEVQIGSSLEAMMIGCDRN